MRRLLVWVACCAVLSGCVTPRPVSAPAPAPWPDRVAALQRAADWQLAGRAAVVVGTQGWQASLDWRQHAGSADLHLAGPLGVGAVDLRQTPAGLSLNGAPPSDAVIAQVQDRLGFDLPLDDFRYWLLGVPAPGSPFEVTQNDASRAQQLAQDGWTMTYDRYQPVGTDLLPTRVVLSREGVRVRVVVDHWETPR